MIGSSLFSRPRLCCRNGGSAVSFGGVAKRSHILGVLSGFSEAKYHTSPVTTAEVASGIPGK